MANNPKGYSKNLKPFHTLTEDEQRAIRSKGGKASGESRRKQSTVQGILKAWADHPIVPEKLKRQAQAFGIDTDDGRALLALAMLQNGMKGNSKYMEKILQLLGEDTPTADAPDDGFLTAIKGTAADDWGDTNV